MTAFRLDFLQRSLRQDAATATDVAEAVLSVHLDSDNRTDERPVLLVACRLIHCRLEIGFPRQLQLNDVLQASDVLRCICGERVSLEKQFDDRILVVQASKVTGDCVQATEEARRE